jgi:copper(I)-binding protein
LTWTKIATYAAFVLTALIQSASGTESHARKSQELVVEHAEIVLAPPGAMMMAGYLTIWNGTRTQAELRSVESDTFGSVSIHRTLVSGDVARMRPVEGSLPIPGQSELLMKRGSIHLMLADPKNPLVEGQAIAMTLVFEDGRRLEALARLFAPGTKATDHHHGGADGTGNE